MNVGMSAVLPLSSTRSGLTGSFDKIDEPEEALATTNAQHDPPHRPSSPLPSTARSSSSPAIDDIRVEYHPNANHPTTYSSYEDYTSALPQPDPSTLPTSPREPWSHFRTRLNFELAEFMQDVRLNEGEMKRLLSIMDRVALHPSDYSIVDFKDLKDMWTAASKPHDSGV